MKKTRNVPIKQQGYVLVTVLVFALLVAAIAFLMNHESAFSTNMAAGELSRDELRYLTEAGLSHAKWQLKQNTTCANYSDLASTSFEEHNYSAVLSPSDGSPVSIAVTGVLANGVADTLVRNNVKVYDATMPVIGVLTVGAGGKDTFIEGDAGHTDHNKGNDAELKTSSEIGREYRTLLQFDLSGLPPTAMVQSATLQLDIKTFNSTDVVEAHRLLHDWTEDGATWNDYNGVSSWNSPGADYDPDVAGSFLADGTGPKSMDITDLAAAWVTGSQPNYGLVLRSPPAAGGNENKYYSSDQVGQPHPELTLTYICECGTACPGLIVGQNVNLSTDSGATLGGLTFDDIDLAEYDPVADSATLFFEGAPTTLVSDIDALHVLANGHLLLSTKDDDTLGGLSFTDGDLIDYDPATDTATLYFDENLFSANEDIISVYLMDNGHILLSTDSDATLGGLSFTDTDLVEYDPASDTATLFFDGSTTTLNSDITAVHLWGNGLILLSTKDAATLGGLSFDDGDLVQYDPATDVATLYFDEDLFFADEDIVSVHAGPGTGGGSGGSKLLMVVIDDASLTSQDDAKITLLESWDYTVSVIDDDDNQATYDAAVAANDVVYITEDAWSGSVGTKLVSAPIGVVAEEVNLNDEFGLSDGVDWESGTQITVDDNSHYITQPFPTGPTTVHTASELFHYLTPAISPDLAHLASSPSGTVLAALDAGTAMVGGGAAAGRRVQLPWGAGNMDINNLTADALTIFRRALEWAGDAASTGPIAHWKLDESGGTTAEDSVGGHDGSLINGPSWTMGQLEGALDFDGSDDYVDLTSDAELDDVFVGGATVMAWIEPAGWGNNGYGRIFDKSTSPSATGDGWAIRVNKDNGGLNFGQGFTGGRGWWRFAESSINFNTWHHIALVYDAGSTANDPIVYLDGSPILVTRVNTPSGAVRSDASINMHLGNHASSAATFFDGKIDDVRIYDRMLSQPEIADLAASSSGLPIAHWKFDETSGTTAVDSEGGHDGTLKNGPFWTTGQIDGALSLDGANDFVAMSAHAASFENLTQGTISAWVYAQDNGTGAIFEASDSGDDTSRIILLRDGGALVFAIHDEPMDFIEVETSASLIPLNTWTHVAVTVDNSGNKLYVNGTQVTSGLTYWEGSSSTNTFFDDVTNLDFIAWGINKESGSNFTMEFDGLIDDARIYDSVLSADDVADLYGGGSGGGGGGCDGTFRDEFNAISFSGDDGTLNWTSNWLEVGESNGPDSGDIRVTDDEDDYQLRTRDNDNGGEGVEREADLSGAITATLSYDFRRMNLDSSSDYTSVEVSANGAAGPWTELTRHDGSGNDSDYQPASHNISSFTSATMRIRFKTSSSMGGTDTVWFDNVEIQCTP